MTGNQQTGGEIVARTLSSAGIDTVFTVSGNQILPIFDAAREAGLRMVHMRHETAAVYAAIGAAEARGGASVALVSAGPGFLASLQGLAVARSMELPVLLLAGAAPLAQRHRGAFQDIDQSSIAAPISKGTFEPRDIATLSGSILEAHCLATSGVTGPVLISLPSDLLTARTAPQKARDEHDAGNPAPAETIDGVLSLMAARLGSARRPVVIARPAAARSKWLSALAGHLGIRPIVTESPRGLSDPRYSDALSRVRDSDCVLVVAPADFASGFLAAAIVGDPGNVLLIDDGGDPAPSVSAGLHCRVAPEVALRYLAEQQAQPTSAEPGWPKLLEVMPPLLAPDDDPADGVHPLAVAEALRFNLAPDDIVVLDGGEFCQWIRLGLRDIPNQMLWNGKLGAIGGSIPMALGARVSAPSRRVIAVLGDGSAGYFLSEFETLSRYGLKITAVIGNDARWAAEWHMQVARYGPERTFDTELTPARYDLAAQGFGAVGFNAGRRTELRSALSAAFESSVAACVNVRVAAVRSPAEVLH
jgi:acetolactate synthase I/II/III large subunit